jgi:hypothetical protein
MEEAERGVEHIEVDRLRRRLGAAFSPSRCMALSALAGARKVSGMMDPVHDNPFPGA